MSLAKLFEEIVKEIRKLGYPLLESFISGSPMVESLSTNPARRVHSILRSASRSIVHQQMRGVAEEVLKILDAMSAVPGQAVAEDF